ncbi:MAG: DNA repair protein RecN, partial [Paludibacteraceae bacterium]|nr:DNA repair protein RecN [Paludibacteraceae bacterium]
AGLQEGEAEELEAELRQLTHVEDIQTAFVSVLQALQADEGGAIESVEQSSDALNRVASYQSDASELGERLHSVYIELDDIRSEIERLSEQLEYDPKRQQYVENRLDTLNTLLQKHHVENETQLILLKQQFEQQLNEISGFDDDIRRLESALQQSRSALDHAAAALSKTRCEVVPLMEQQLEQQLRLLGIPHPQFKAQIQPTTSPTATGQDDIRFLFAANKNQQLRDVSQVASGGEVSRLMLCIKAMLADSQALPTLIFDEIDTGVSGEVADAMGDIMQRMGSGIQVLAITHLPQIAVKGGAHYLVYKTDTEQRTESHIRRLNDAERVDHIAQMLSGSVVTEAARKNAQELLQHNS